MKLHRLEPASSDLSAQTAHLADKYASRLGFGSGNSQQQQRPFSSRKAGRYPPSRDDEFHTMLETDQFNDQLAKGGHGVPLTSCVALPLSLLPHSAVGTATDSPSLLLLARRLPQRPVL